MTEPGKLKKTLKEASPIFTKDSKESMIVNLGSEKRDLSLVNESFSSNNLDFSLNNISENVGEPHLIKSWSSYENQVDSKEIKTKAKKIKKSFTIICLHHRILLSCETNH